MQFLLLLGVAAAEWNKPTTLDFAVDKRSQSFHSSKIQVQSNVSNSAGLTVVLEMGSDKQKVAILLDTGSDLFWIRKKSCSTCFKAEDFDSGSFDTSTSTTYSASSGNFVTESLGSYGYGDGTTLLNCELAVDRMMIGDLQVPNQTFCAVNQMFAPSYVSDGIMGLSIPARRVADANIFNVNGLKPYFGFWYHTISGNFFDGGKVTLGGDDPSLRAGDLITIPASISTDQEIIRFTIALTEVSIGNTVFASGNTSVLVDTGTVATLFPTALADALKSRLAPLIDDNCGANNQEIVSFAFGTGIPPITMKLSQLLVNDNSKCFSYVSGFLVYASILYGIRLRKFHHFICQASCN